MRIFEMLPNLARWRSHTYPNLEGAHEWHLPSIKCEVCGNVWGHSGLAYPWVDVSHLSERRRFRGVSVVSSAEFQNAIAPVRQIVGTDLPLLPGIDLGPYAGRYHGGAMDDFFLYFSNILMTDEAFNRLRRARALANGATSARITTRNASQIELVEVHAFPCAILGANKTQMSGQFFCPSCGFDQRSLPKPLAILAGSVPAEQDVFKLVEDVGTTLVSERFVNAVQTMGMSGIEFRDVNLV